MVPTIGKKYFLDGNKLVHVKDRDNINMIAKVGVPDENNMMWDTEWVEWDRLSENPRKIGTPDAGGFIPAGETCAYSDNCYGKIGACNGEGCSICNGKTSSRPVSCGLARLNAVIYK